jgi:hypothetical protein
MGNLHVGELKVVKGFIEPARPQMSLTQRPMGVRVPQVDI